MKRRPPLSYLEWEIQTTPHKDRYELQLDDSKGSDRAGVAPAGADAAVLPVLSIKGKEEGPTLLILAGVHGDEYEGMETVLRIFHTLRPEMIRGRVLLLPTANPYAFRSRSRMSPEDGVNLARAFPGNEDGTVTERLAHVLHHQFIAKADFLLDLHSGGTHYSVATLTGYYHNEQSELGQRGRLAAEAFGIPVLWGHECIPTGRTISSAHGLGIPWLYTEAYGGQRIRDDDRNYFYGGTLRLMHHLGMLKQPERWHLAEKKPASYQTLCGDGNFDRSAQSSDDGFFVPAVQLLSPVAKGEKLGVIYQMNGSIIQVVRADKQGIVVMLPGSPLVSKGEPLFLIATEFPGVSS